MHFPASPSDRFTRLTRRLLVAAVLSFAAIRLVPLVLDIGARHPPETETRILPTAPTPIHLPGPGHLLEPFEADVVDHTAFGWALLDRTAGGVLVLDSAGRVYRRFGRRGAGPGELERPARIALGEGAQVAVLDATGQRLDIFPESGLPRRIPLPAHDCSGTFGDEVVRHLREWWVLRRCFEGPNADIEVLRVPPTGVPVQVERRELTRMNSDPHLVPILLAYAGVLYAGSNRDACLVEVGAAPATEPRLCLPRPDPIEIPDSVATRQFGDLGRRAAAVGMDLEIPTHYPGLVGARISALGPVVRTILADGSDAWAFESEGALRVLVPDGDTRLEPGESNWLLLRDEGAGLRVWTVPVLSPRLPR
jgi:hypothetical protein